MWGNLEMSKYDPLREFLKNSASDCSEIKLTLKQIEIILRQKLPEASYVHYAWWHDSTSHSHVESWEGVGWKVSTHAEKGRMKSVAFRRERKQQASSR